MIFITWWSSSTVNRRFLKITGKDNLTVFSYSRRVKSPEWRWQQRRADLRQFYIFRHEPIIIYTRLPAGETYYPICMFPASSECLIGISDAFSAFCLRVFVILPMCSLYPQQKRAYSVLHPQTWTYIYRSMPKGSYWVQTLGFLKTVYSHQHHEAHSKSNISWHWQTVQFYSQFSPTPHNTILTLTFRHILQSVAMLTLIFRHLLQVLILQSVGLRLSLPFTSIKCQGVTWGLAHHSPWLYHWYQMAAHWHLPEPQLLAPWQSRHQSQFADC